MKIDLINIEQPELHIVTSDSWQSSVKKLQQRLDAQQKCIEQLIDYIEKSDYAKLSGDLNEP